MEKKSTSDISQLSAEEIAILSIKQLLKYTSEIEKVLLRVETLKKQVHQAIELRSLISNEENED